MKIDYDRPRAAFSKAPTKLMLIDGEWVESSSGEFRDIGSPAEHGLVLGRIPVGNSEDVERAVRAARKALGLWRAHHFTTRQRTLDQIADAIEDRAEELALITAADTGNALRTQARPEVAALVDLFRYFSGVASEIKGNTLPAGDDQLQYTRLEPVGVVGAVLPWNSPLMIAGFKLPAALAAGNTVVLKPAEDAPLSILLLAEICSEFLPDGVLNVITGKGSVVGNAIVEHPGIDKISFTGSTEVGRGVARLAGDRLAHVSLELGGKNPSIVFPDADGDDLINQLLMSTRFHRQGQSCTAGSRLFIHESRYDEVLDALVSALGDLKVGDPRDEATDMGAVINATQHKAIAEYLDEGRNNPGIVTSLGGETPTDPRFANGFYHVPTVFSGATNDFRLAREEIFGPVLVAIPWKEVDEVVGMANDSNYGLATYLWGRDLDTVLSTAHRIDAGWIQVNQGGGQVVGQSYGGYKESGIGREVSLEGMISGFTQTKQINVRLRG